MIVIPSWAWRTVVKRFTSAAGMLERVAFLDGVAFGPTARDGGVVTTVTLPEAKLDRGHYRVASAAMSDAGKHLREHRLVRIAQVHCHPGRGVGHSRVDDEQAYSQASGAISIVLPTWARTHPGLGDAGIHLREMTGWRELRHDELDTQVCIVPSELDFRNGR
jgi:hypothetical protein